MFRAFDPVVDICAYLRASPHPGYSPASCACLPYHLTCCCSYSQLVRPPTRACAPPHTSTPQHRSRSCQAALAGSSAPPACSWRREEQRYHDQPVASARASPHHAALNADAYAGGGGEGMTCPTDRSAAAVHRFTDHGST